MTGIVLQKQTIKHKLQEALTPEKQTKFSLKESTAIARENSMIVARQRALY